MGRNTLIIALCSLLLAACGGISADINRLSNRFEPLGFAVDQKQYGRFKLREAARQGAPNGPVWIVYAGDGVAWLDTWTPSPDPTPSPKNMPSISVAQAIAKQFATDTVIHLSRPCQFLTSNAQDCGTRYWTRDRFGDDVRNAYHAHATQFDGRPVIFVGWSGGGVLAAHMAHIRAMHNRQTGALTLASPLDLTAWTQWHRVSALPQADNPAQFLPLVIHHSHAVGSNDKIVPPETVSHLPNQFIVPIDHHGPWHEIAIQAAPSLRAAVIAAQP